MTLWTSLLHLLLFQHLLVDTTSVLLPLLLELIHILKFFLPSTIKLWNSLPDSLIELDDINQFKEDLAILTSLPSRLIHCMYNYLCVYALFEFLHSNNNNNKSIVASTYTITLKLFDTSIFCNKSYSTR